MTSSLPTALTVGQSRTIADRGIHGTAFSESSFLAALQLLHPRPQVVLFGGGQLNEEADQAQKIFEDFWNEVGKERGRRRRRL